MTTDLDKKFVWHPCTQMKDHEILPPIEIVKGEGSILFDNNGNKYIDGISSWWVNLLGHSNPELNKELRAQSETLEHVIFAGFTHKYAAKLAAELCRLAPGDPKKVFFTDCGSAAVEVALKMSFQYWLQTGKPKKKRFVSLSGAYHGETLGALSVGGCELYRELYKPLMLDTFDVPGPDCRPCNDEKTVEERSLAAFEILRKTVEKNHEEIAAIFIEPLVQCANNMNIYSPIYLKKLRELCNEFEIHLVADEIAVGYGRTGKWFACEHAGIVPDFLCTSKGLTGGYMPFAATIIQDAKVFDAFYGEYSEYKAFYHSHSYTGNPMACRIALKVIEILETKVMSELPERIEVLEEILKKLSELKNVGATRQCGFIGAVELFKNTENFEKFPADKRVGWNVYRKALEKGALLRPLGDVIYFLAPLNIPIKTLRELGNIAYDSIKETTE